MIEFSKSQRKALRELAARIREAETRQMLERLDQQFARWRGGQLGSGDLLDAIHEFQKGPARQLWSMHQSLKEPELVARGVALGLASLSELPEDVRPRLAPLVEFFARGPGLNPP